MSGSATAPGRRFAAAAERNAGPILAVLRDVVPSEGRALEVASGTGQHVCGFARAFPGIIWQPSDPDPAARASIAAWREAEGTANILPPLDVDVTQPDWQCAVAGGLDLVVCINLIHIAPWDACEGLLSGSARLLRPDGVLFLYGPYRRGGRHTARSNADFDRSLRGRDPRWGVRDLEAVERSAGRHGFTLDHLVEMPANNLSVLLRRGAARG